MPKAANDEERVQFGERVCFRLDKDAREVLNAMNIKWTSQGHAMNAFVRRANQNVIPDGMALPEHPFDAMALDGPPPKVKRLLSAKGGKK